MAREPILQDSTPEKEEDRALRPQRMSEMVGQREVYERLLIVVDAARKRDEALGHILFTAVRLKPASDITAAILAPLAVMPEAQNQGIGGRLIEEGISILADMDIDVVFCLVYPDYYNRHGFSPAGAQGFNAPYPILEKNADAWMLHAINPEAAEGFSGTVICADALMKEEYWVE